MRRDDVLDPHSDFETDPRFPVEREVVIETGKWSGSSEKVAATLINFSRHGFWVRIASDLVPDAEVTLEIEGWPALAARVAWSHDGRAGCKLAKALDDDRYGAIILSADAINRAGEWHI